MLRFQTLLPNEWKSSNSSRGATILVYKLKFETYLAAVEKFTKVWKRPDTLLRFGMTVEREGSFQKGG